MSAGFQRHREASRSGSNAANPTKPKTKFHSLLRELEIEFDKVAVENAQLRERIAVLESENGDEFNKSGLDSTLVGGKAAEEHDMFDKNVLKSKAIKTRHKLKAHTSKIVSSFKPPQMSCMLVKEFRVIFLATIAFFVQNNFVHAEIGSSRWYLGHLCFSIGPSPDRYSIG